MIRGQAHTPQRSTQVRDFSGLCYGNITPSDIDGFIEYKNSCYVIYEAKLPNGKLEGGQRLGLERLCDDLQKIKPTLLIVFEHFETVTEPIDFSNGVVIEYRYNKKAHVDPDRFIGKSVKFITDEFLKRHGSK